MFLMAGLIVPTSTATIPQREFHIMSVDPVPIEGRLGGFEPHILAGPSYDDSGIWYYYDSPSGLLSKAQEPFNMHVPGNLWISKDLGQTWEYKEKKVIDSPYNPGGSGDTFTAISKDGAIYHTDLYLSSASVDTSLNGGDNWVLNTVASWVGDIKTGVIVDRQWLDIGPTIGGAVGDQTLYFTYNNLAGGLVMIKADVTGQGDLALVWEACNGGTLLDSAPITTDVAARDNHAVNEEDGIIYITNYASNARVIEVFKSTDGCQSFTSSTIKQTENRAEAQNIFTVIDTDMAGNVYVTWSSRDQMWMAVSTDQAETWTIHQVTTTHAVKTLPWLDAGDEGMVAMGWYEAGPGTEGASDGVEGWWDLKVGTTFNAHNETPIFDIYTVEAEVHEGGIQTTGTGGGSDRDLGDYLTVHIDPYGRLLVAYGNDAEDGGEANSRQSHPMFAGQLDGPFFRVGKGPQINATHSLRDNLVVVDIVSISDPDFPIFNVTVYWGDETPGLEVFGLNSTPEDPSDRSLNHNYPNRNGRYNLTIQATNEIGMRSTLVIPITIKAEDEGWTIAGLPGWAVMLSLFLLLAAIGVAMLMRDEDEQETAEALKPDEGVLEADQAAEEGEPEVLEAEQDSS